MKLIKVSVFLLAFAISSVAGLSASQEMFSKDFMACVDDIDDECWIETIIGMIDKVEDDFTFRTLRVQLAVELNILKMRFQVWLKETNDDVTTYQEDINASSNDYEIAQLLNKIESCNYWTKCHEDGIALIELLLAKYCPGLSTSQEQNLFSKDFMACVDDVDAECWIETIIGMIEQTEDEYTFRTLSVQLAVELNILKIKFQLWLEETRYKIAEYREDLNAASNEDSIQWTLSRIESCDRWTKCHEDGITLIEQLLAKYCPGLSIQGGVRSPKERKRTLRQSPF